MMRRAKADLYRYIQRYPIQCPSAPTQEAPLAIPDHDPVVMSKIFNATVVNTSTTSRTCDCGQVSHSGATTGPLHGDLHCSACKTLASNDLINRCLRRLHDSGDGGTRDMDVHELQEWTRFLM